MARTSDIEIIERHSPKTPNEIRACAHVHSVSGLAVDSIQSIAPDESAGGPYLVRGCGYMNQSFDFICAEGLLVGIPPGFSKP